MIFGKISHSLHMILQIYTDKGKNKNKQKQKCLKSNVQIILTQNALKFNLELHLK